MEVRTENIEGMDDILTAESGESFQLIKTKIDNLRGKNQDLRHSNEELLCIIEAIRTEKAQIEADHSKLTAEKRQLDELMDQLGGGVLVLDESLSISSFTPSSAATLHILPSDIGRPLEDLVTKLDISSAEIAAWAESVQRTKVPHAAMATMEQGGRCLVRVGPMESAGGVVVTFTDICGYDAGQERWFDGSCRALVEASCDVLLEVSEGGEIASRVRGWENFTGQGWPDHRGLGWLQMVEEESRDEVLAGWREATSKQPLAVLEVPLWSAEHHRYRRCSLRAVPKQGAERSWLAAITEVEHWQSDLLDGGSRTGLLESVFDNSDTGVLVTGIDGEVLLVNERAMELFGDVRKGDIVGRSLWELMPSEAARAWRDMDEQVVAGLEQLTIECGNPVAELGSSPETYFTIKFPLLSQGGTTPHGVGTIITDITLQKAGQQREKERIREVDMINRELEAKNRDLDEFAHMVSHDLKQPLRIIENYACMLEEECGDSLTDDATSFLRRLEAASRRACELVEATLSYARLGRSALSRSRVDLRGLVEEAVGHYREVIDEQDVSVEIGVLPVVECDPDMVFHVFSNLIGNAIKYRRPGVAPLIEITYEEEEGIPAFSVKDNGIGIDPSYAERVFEPFQRLHAEEHIPGTGIGLAITRKIVERHGGEIDLRPAGEGGTVVTFTLEKANIQIN